ncbi:MAG TPA: aminotransferase class V-fold PLP-dependent enzyme [Trebonia sp.]
MSQLLAPVAAGLSEGARVLAPDIEFTSNLFPWLVHADRGVTVETVPPAKLAEAIDDRTTIVTFSLVQSATGEIARVDDIVTAARRHGSLVCVDATQAVGWLPVDATRFDVLVCSAYKWLAAPRGAAFAYLSRRFGIGSARCTRAGTPARTRGTPTTGRRCGSRHRRAGSTSRRRGSPMWARPPRRGC